MNGRAIGWALAGVLLVVPAAVPATATATPGPASAEASGTSVVDGELLVVWRSSASSGSRAEARARAGLRQAEVRRVARDIDLVRAPSGEPVATAIAELRRDPRVADAQPNYRYQRAADPYLPSQWGLANTGQQVLGVTGLADIDVNAPQAWAGRVGYGSPGVVVAVIDTGVKITHPDLDGNVWVNADEVPGNGIDDDANGFVDDVRGWDFHHRDATVYDGEDCGSFNNDDHGTHVAGTVAAETNGSGVVGVAPAIRLMVLKTIGCNGGTTADVAGAINYAAANGARIANLSLGGPANDAVLRSVIEASGLLVVAAAGNGTVGGTSSSCSKSGGDPVSICPMYPAAFPSPNIVSVGAVDSRGNRASFSQYGRTGPDGTTASGVDLVAPGTSILSTFVGRDGADQYAYLDGTSMAAPHVTGAAALAASDLPAADAAALKQRVVGFVRPLASASTTTAFGGLVDAAASATGTASPVTGTAISVSRSTSLMTAGASVTLSTRLTTSGGAAMPGRPAVLLRYTAGSSGWVQACSTTTSTAGTAWCSQKPVYSTGYMWHFPGAPGFAASWSPYPTVQVRPGISAALSPSVIGLGGTAKFYGIVSPNRSGVTVRLQSWYNGQWVTVARTRVNSTSRYSFTLKPGARAKQTLRVYFSGDSRNAAQSTSVRYLTIV